MEKKLTSFEKVNVFENSFGIYSFEDLPLDIKSKIISLYTIEVDNEIKEMGLILNGENGSHNRESYIEYKIKSYLFKKFYANIQGNYYELYKV